MAVPGNAPFGEERGFVSAAGVAALRLPGGAMASRQAVVLVVDDDADQRDLLTLWLKAEGHAVRTACHAEEAMAVLAGALPDVVILDVLMPGIDGFEVCRRIRANPHTLDLPVVLVTALNSREERVNGIQAGADDFLSKPVNREELIARVNSVARLSFARKALEQARLRAQVAKTERLRQTFERYVAPSLVEQILSSPDAGSALMQTRRADNVVAMFADLRGFTRMCSRLEVEAAVGILNGFFTQVVDVAKFHQGTTLGMAGDNLLVGFNVPVPQADATRRAVLCAMDMLEQVAPLQDAWRETYGVDLGLGVGISRGSAIFGNVGAPSHMAYTLIGDAVNVAARLTQLAVGGEILLSGDAAADVPKLLQQLNFEPMVPISLKGKDRPMPYFRLTRTYTQDDLLKSGILLKNERGYRIAS